MIRIAISVEAIRGDCPDAPARQRGIRDKTDEGGEHLI